LVLPRRRLVDVGLVALSSERDPAADTVDHRHLLEGERDLVEIAADQLPQLHAERAGWLTKPSIAHQDRRSFWTVRQAAPELGAPAAEHVVATQWR